jgi:hypothetical protein
MSVNRPSPEDEIATQTPAKSPTSTRPVSSTHEEQATIGVSGNDEPPPYSHFTKRQKRLIVFLVTFGATFSPLSSFIFFPAINALSASLNVSVEKINLTITSYMIVAGIAPAIIGDMADFTGRRVVYLITMGIYCIANIGIALQKSWTALFLLRMVQSAGSAGASKEFTYKYLLHRKTANCYFSDNCYWLWCCG